MYRLAEELADSVWNIVARWPRFARDTLGKQLVRSSDSIGANIAEGCGRGSYLDNRRFVYIARGSLYESKHLLRLAFRRSLLAPGDVEKLVPILENLSPMLNAYLHSIGARDT